MLAFLSVLLAVVIVYILCFHYESIRAIYVAFNIPGPRALPIIGNGLLFFNKSSPEIFDTICDLIKGYGVYLRIWFGPELNVIVSDPKDVEIILSSSKYIDKSNEYRFVKSWLNEGLLLSTGKKWHERRKIITPAFHFKILEQFVEVFDRIGNVVVDKLKQYDPTDDVEFYPIAVLYALDVMCETAMGVSIDALSKPNSDYVKAVKEIVYVLHKRMFDFVLRFPVLYQYSWLFKREENALRVLHGFTDSVIHKRRRELLTMKINNNENTDGNGQSPTEANDEHIDVIGIKQKRAFLDLLLHSSVDGKPLTDLEIREEVDTFLFEGHDTTTSGITFCLYNIAKHPEVQEKCIEEIVSVFGTDGKQPITLSQLNQLAYLDMVIKESLRLYPSVPLIGRKAMEDIKLTNNRIVPAGSNIIVPIYHIGRNEALFKDADEFKPERFKAERSMESQNAFSYIPFSAGPRNCIGQKFAVMEMKSIISKILRNFEVTATDECFKRPILSAELILRPENRISFYFKPRKY